MGSVIICVCCYGRRVVDVLDGWGECPACSIEESGYATGELVLPLLPELGVDPACFDLCYRGYDSLN
jgi:hypothetical protein